MIAIISGMHLFVCALAERKRENRTAISQPISLLTRVAN